MEEETLFERLARERNITVEEMRAIISARIEGRRKGRNEENNLHHADRGEKKA